MDTTVVYESMFGQTRRIAEAIARGIRSAPGGARAVTVRVASEATTTEVGRADLLVIGAPTHGHSLSRPSTRDEAERWTHDPDRRLTLEPDALRPGVREFIERLPDAHQRFAAFGTRATGPALLTGTAATTIRRRLERKGMRSVATPETFRVDGHGLLVDGEELRAEDFGRRVALRAVELQEARS